MNIIEALAVIAVVRGGAIPQEFSDERLKEIAGYLLPLPYDYCRRAAERWAISVPVDEHGQPVPKFVSEPSAVLTGCGVPFGTRHLLDRALRDGGEVYPSVRGAISDGGWEYVAAGEPLPLGVAEAMLAAGQTLPHNRACAELPAGPIEQRDEPTDATDALAVIGRGLQARKNGALRRAFEQRQHPPAPIAWDRDAMPPVLREAVEAAERAQDRATKAEQRCQAQERAYRELCADLADRIRDGAPDSETARAVVVELLQRLLSDPGYGLSACVEALRDALIPGAEVAVKPAYGPNPDPFDDGVGPLIELRIALKEKHANQ